MFLGIRLVKPSNPSSASLKDVSDENRYIFRCGESHISIKKRLSYPTTFWSTERGILTFGYGNQDQQNLKDEFLLGSFDVEAMSLQLNRDAFCTLPLFYYMSPELCLVSDDLDWIVDQSPELTLDKVALDDLLNRPVIDSRTLFSEIRLLTDQATLLWRPGKSQVRQPEFVSDTTLPADAHDFKANLELTLERYWQLVSSVEASVAFEVSGGIDSSTMPLVIYRAHKPAMLIASMRFIEGFQVTQDKKITELSDYCGAKLAQVDIDKNLDYPLARFFEPNLALKPFYQYQEIYSEALTKLAIKLKSKGVSVVFTGIGGDELFENIEDSLPRPVAEAAFFAGQSRNKLYIDQDIWPISPLADPALRAYCQALDLAYRSNKNVLRAYHEAAGFPASIYNPIQNEHFGRFFEDAVRQNYQKLLHRLAPDSQLQKLGYLNSVDLLEAYNSARWKEIAGDELFKVFRYATAEVILQSAAKKLKQPAAS